MDRNQHSRMDHVPIGGDWRRFRGADGVCCEARLVEALRFHQHRRPNDRRASALKGLVMAPNKTKPTSVTPSSYLATLPDQQRKDSKELIAMMRAITGEP